MLAEPEVRSALRRWQLLSPFAAVSSTKVSDIPELQWVVSSQLPGFSSGRRSNILMRGCTVFWFLRAGGEALGVSEGSKRRARETHTCRTDGESIRLEGLDRNLGIMEAAATSTAEPQLNTQALSPAHTLPEVETPSPKKLKLAKIPTQTAPWYPGLEHSLNLKLSFVFWYLVQGGPRHLPRGGQRSQGGGRGDRPGRVVGQERPAVVDHITICIYIYIYCIRVHRILYMTF